MRAAIDAWLSKARSRGLRATVSIMSMLLLALNTAPCHAQASSFPTKPIRILVGFPPGGAIDGVLHVMALQVSKALGQQVLLDYRPGAGGTVSLVQLKNSPPDGYTLALITKGAFRAPAVEEVAYDPLKDLTYVVGLADLPFGVVVRSDAPWKSWEELMAYGREQPEKINYGAAGGWGNSAHLFVEELTSEAKVKWNGIAYKGTADAEQALMGRQLDFSVNGSVGGGLLDSGKLRLLAVTSEQRSSRWPDVRTMRELGFKASIDSRWGLAGPKDLPASVVTRIQDEFKKVLGTPEVQNVLQRYGQSASYMSASEFSHFAIRSVESEGELVRKYGFGKGQKR